jgi:orotate phosphoribosyltransferase-like protein
LTSGVERACALREQGLLLREIAAAMGVARKTVHGWLSDPDAAKPRSERATGSSDG